MEQEPSVSTSMEAISVNVPRGPEVIPTPTVALWTSAVTIHVVSMPNVTMKEAPTDVNALKDSKETQHNNVLVRGD